MGNIKYSKLIEQKEIENIRMLKSAIKIPEKFLEMQNRFFYNRNMSIFWNDKSKTDKAGLPLSANRFYKSKKKRNPKKRRVNEQMILNIGSGLDSSKKLEAINLDMSAKGKPDIIADAKLLPCKSGIFTIVRASHILEHIPQDKIINTLREWKRVVHRNGELQIAVPDAEIVFKEMINGKTVKGNKAFSLKKSTSTLAQIYGIGYNNPNTDKRWLHRVIFSYSLLKYFLNAAGFEIIERRSKKEDLAYIYGIDDDSQNHYSLLVSAKRKRERHFIESPLKDKSFKVKIKINKSKGNGTRYVSYIIPIYNEAKNLEHFLKSLEYSTNELQSKREFVFVINGCTDDSEEIIRRYLKKGNLNYRIKMSERGIVKAFISGISARKLKGFIGKIDADVILDKNALDLMELCLIENKNVQITYAEPIPMGQKNIYNEAEYHQYIRSKRLYYHGRVSLYRKNPFLRIKNKNAIKEIAVEDILFSFYCAYYYGLDSIRRASYAIIYSKPIKSIFDLAKQIIRTKKEKEIIFKYYPQFEILDKLFYREIYSKKYKILVNKAMNLNIKTRKCEWTRIESTK